MSEWNDDLESISSVEFYESHEAQKPQQRERRGSNASFSAFNIQRTHTRVQEVCCFGKIRAFNTFTRLDWIYYSVSLVALTISLGFTLESLTTGNPSTSDFTFAILMLINILFCYHYIVHATFTECWDELFVFVASNVIILIYCILNYFYYKDISDQYTMKLVRLIFVCLLSPFFIVAGIVQMYRYYHSSNYLYDVIGPYTDLQNTCRLFLICVSLLKFDLQLQISMLVLIMSKGLTALTSIQKILLATGFPITVIFVIVGYLGLRFESIRLVVSSYFLGLLEDVYVIYKIIDTAEQTHPHGVIHVTTFACGCFTLCISVLLFLSTLYYSKYCFGKGLKDRLFRRSSITPLPEVGSVHYSTFT